MTADQPRPLSIPAASSLAGLSAATTRIGWTPPVQTWDLDDTESRDVETRVEWGVRYVGRDVVSRETDERSARYWARMSRPEATVVSRTVHVGPWEVAS